MARLGLNSISDSSYHYTLAYAGCRYTREGLLFTQRAGWLEERFDNLNLQRTPLQKGGYREAIWNGDASKSWAARLVTEAGWGLRRLRDRGFSDRAGTAATVRIDEHSGSGTRAGVYAQQSWSVTPRIQIRFGGRRDRHSIDSRGVWLGNAGLALPAWRGARWHLAWAQTAQYPDLQQFLSRGGRRTLEPERAAQAQIGLEQSIGERSRVRVEFYDRADRQLLFRPFGEIRLLANGAIFAPPLVTAWDNSVRGYARGGQVFFQRRAANGFTGWVSYGYNRARLRDRRTGVSFDSDFDVRHLFQVYASQRLRPTVNLSGKWIYGSGAPVPYFFELRGPSRESDVFLSRSRNLLRLPGYQRTDVRINLKSAVELKLEQRSG